MVAEVQRVEIQLLTRVVVVLAPCVVQSGHQSVVVVAAAQVVEIVVVNGAHQ